VTEVSDDAIDGVGFRDPQAARERIQAHDAELASLGRPLLEALGRIPDPDRALHNLLRILGRLGSDSDAVLHNPERMRSVVRLAGASDYLADLLAAQPELLGVTLELLGEPMADERITHLLRDGRRSVKELGDPPALDTLRGRELALIAMKDLEGVESARVSRAMSALAETIIELALELSTALWAERWGLPEEDGGPTRFAVIGCGKVGSGELVYGSDLDVIFVCDPGGTCTKRDERGGEEFWTRVAQHLMSGVQERNLYEIDARLRPWGVQGKIVVNLNTLRKYWDEPRDVWERLAMTRAVPIAGDPDLGREATAIIRGAAIGRPLPEDALKQVADMRRRMQELAAGKEHVKLGPGGYVDAEFVAQLYSLGQPADDLPPGASIDHTLLALSTLEVLPLEAAVELGEGLRLLRLIEARMRLRDGGAGSVLPSEAEARELLAKRCGFEDAAALDAAVAETRKRLRSWFEELVGPVEPA
jgi:glutamate-ammonia-ligase adenylyltransferase